AVGLTSFGTQGATWSYRGSADPSSTTSAAMFASHVTRADAGSIADDANRSESLRFAEFDSEQVPPSTRSTFMAHWQRMPGAKSYRLDVSTESSFRTFVEGF